MRKYRKLLVIFGLCFVLAGCGSQAAQESDAERAAVALEEEGGLDSELSDQEKEVSAAEDGAGLSKDAAQETESNQPDSEAQERDSRQSKAKAGKDRSEQSGEMEAQEVIYVDVPAYSGDGYTVVNGNEPYFSEDELSAVSYEEYSELDELGRCGVCVASVGQDIMPTEDRESIGAVKPTGWHTAKYEGMVDGNYLYNRCHLLGFQLTGENANAKNLITGTRYMNVEGMLPFENMVADYVKETGNHVMYRVTPLFDGDNLVADGVLMEAKSVEDDGDGVLFNVFCYNVQPGIAIDYATGESWIDTTASETDRAESAPAGSGSYAVNGANGKIHITGACPATGTGDTAMAEPVYFDTYEEAAAYSLSIAPGLDKRQCGNCW